jgi:glycosyltransferase involved in cell wall biosynthesis
MISVVIPVLNRHSQLMAAVESVRQQADQDWEILIVDDGSTDGSLEVAVRLQESDPRIRPLIHPHRMNLGPGASRNLGVEAARGEIVAFLDSDDCFVPDTFNTLLVAFNRFPDVPVVYGRALQRGERGDGSSFGQGIPEVPADIFPQLVRNNVVRTGAIAVRRDVLGDFPFPPEMPNSQDWACWLKLALNHPFLFVDQDLVVLQIQKGSITAHGLSSVTTHCRYTIFQAQFLKKLAESLSGDRAMEVRRGLRWRSAECLLRALFSLRGGQVIAAFRWLTTSMRIGGEPRLIAGSIREATRTWIRFRAGEARPLFIQPVDVGEDMPGQRR